MENKKCKECGTEMHKDYSPKVASLANEASEIPKPKKVWRCEKGHIEAYE